MQLTCHGFQERYKDLRDFYVDNPPFKNYQNSEKKKKTEKMFSWLFLIVTVKTHEGEKLARNFFLRV